MSYFHWLVLYVRPEIYEAMSCIVIKSLKVGATNLFISNYGKSMTLEEFEQQQTQTMTTVIKYLKEPWLEKITQSVRMCLRDIGKGWFNLDQKYHDVYDVMKLNRFMTLTMLRMQV